MAAVAFFLALPLISILARPFLIAIPEFILIPLCPCGSANCAQCACDACVERVVIATLSVIITIPVLFYLRVIRRRRRIN